jgi:hypothetical protein
MANAYGPNVQKALPPLLVNADNVIEPVAMPQVEAGYVQLLAVLPLHQLLPPPPPPPPIS